MSLRNLPLLVPQRKPLDPYATRWATVTGTSPLRVKLDGESSPLGITPDMVIPAVLPGDRVLLQIINRRICIVGRVATNMDLNGYVRAIRTTNTQGSFAAKLAADAGDRWTAYADGALKWGDGSASPQDVNLYRAGASILATDDELRSIRGAASDNAFTAQVSGDSNRRFAMSADGTAWWGPGNAAADVNLYRAAPDTLATDDAFKVKGLPVLRGESNFTSCTISSATSGTFNVTFATAFPSRPNVVVPNINSGAGSTSGWEGRAINITTTGFTIFLFGASSSFSVDVMWTATLT